MLNEFIKANIGTTAANFHIVCFSHFRLPHSRQCLLELTFEQRKLDGFILRSTQHIGLKSAILCASIGFRPYPKLTPDTSVTAFSHAKILPVRNPRDLG